MTKAKVWYYRYTANNGWWGVTKERRERSEAWVKLSEDGTIYNLWLTSKSINKGGGFERGKIEEITAADYARPKEDLFYLRSKTLEVKETAETG